MAMLRARWKASMKKLHHQGVMQLLLYIFSNLPAAGRTAATATAAAEASASSAAPTAAENQQ